MKEGGIIWFFKCIWGFSFCKNFFQKVEKISYLSREYKAGAVREHVPLKQGLKHHPGRRFLYQPYG